MIAYAGLFVSACATEDTMSSRGSALLSSSAGDGTASATGPGRAAARASADTRQACLACLDRIRRYASAGQRIIAKATYKRDEVIQPRCEPAGS